MGVLVPICYLLPTRASTVSIHPILWVTVTELFKCINSGSTNRCNWDNKLQSTFESDNERRPTGDPARLKCPKIPGRTGPICYFPICPGVPRQLWLLLHRCIFLFRLSSVVTKQIVFYNIAECNEYSILLVSLATVMKRLRDRLWGCLLLQYALWDFWSVGEALRCLGNIAFSGNPFGDISSDGGKHGFPRRLSHFHGNKIRPRCIFHRV